MENKRVRSKYRNVLIGEGSLAMHCAEILLRREHQLVGILTGDARLADWARRRQVPVFVPNGNFAELLRRYEFDYLFSVANLQILPAEVLALPKRGTINFHDSPLPRYAGVHATSWALMRSERRHGVTWHAVTERVDAGEILGGRPVEIEEGETAGSLNVKCFEAAVGSFDELLDGLERQQARPAPQDLSQRSYFGRWKRPPAAALVDWNRSAEQISALARALDFGHYPNPLAAPKLVLGSAAVAFSRLEVLDRRSGSPPGTLLAIDANTLTVATATEDVRIGGLTEPTGQPLGSSELAARAAPGAGARLGMLTRDERSRLSRLNRAICRHEAFWVERLSRTERCVHPRVKPGAADSPLERLPVGFEGALGRYLERRPAASRLAVGIAALAAAFTRGTESERLDVAVPAAASGDPDVGTSPGGTATAASLFAGSVPMRLEIEPTATFDELVDRVETELDDLAGRRTFAHDVFLRYPELRGRWRESQPTVAVTQAGGTTAEPPLPTGAAIGLAIGDRAELLWRPAGVEAGFARELAQDLERILEAAATDELPLDALPAAPPASIEPLLAALNATEADYPRDATVHALFERQAARVPERIAVECRGETLTYGELERRASRLARVLAERGVGPGSTVGVLLDRTLRLPVALLGVLEAGAAYLPLDPDYPADRLALMLDDSGAELLLTERAVSERRPRTGAEVLILDDEPGPPGERLPSQARADDLAYVIYTSGSTGRPKGVEIEHRSVVNFLTSMAREPGLTEDDVVLAITTVSFDISVLELFLPLTVGASVCLVSREVAADGVLLAKALEASGVTVMQATPASWRLLLDAGWTGDPALTALCGGEALPPQLAERLLERCGALWNVYGPTETTIWSTVARVASAAPPISIGRPIANTRVYVVDEALEPVAPGRTGELVIGGDGLARGYHDRPELTAERFVDCRSERTGPGRLYRTGDLARITVDGSLECLGRIDHQVKIRGFRIEPGEIESALESHPAVQTAVVVAREDASGLKRLIAYLVPMPGEPAGPRLIDDLRARLGAELPPHMIPSAFVEMAELPLTGSGKVDRKALPEPASATRTPTGALPATEVERAIAAAWEEALELRPIGVDDDFFAIGGHSLLLHQVRTRLQKSLGVELTMVELFRHSTVAGLAAHLGRRHETVCDDGERAVYARGNQHPIAVMARRFLIPRPLLTLYFYWRFKAKISPRAEVELSPNLELGRGTTIGSFTKVKADKGPLVIGERSSFANGCFIGSGPAGLRIGKNLVCGPNVTIVPSNYVIDKKNVALADQGHTSKGIVIGDNVWIGAGSTILDGSELGDNTIVAAGSVVDRKFDGDCVVRGNPAQVVIER